jgi:hypothetical protein
MKFNDAPIFIHLDTQRLSSASRTDSDPESALQVYETAFSVDKEASVTRASFVKTQHKFESTEAERIAVEHFSKHSMVEGGGTSDGKLRLESADC